MSKRDRDYIPDKLTDVPSDRGSDEYLPTTPTTEISQSFSYVAMTPDSERMPKTYVYKYKCPPRPPTHFCGWPKRAIFFAYEQGTFPEVIC